MGSFANKGRNASEGNATPLKFKTFALELNAQMEAHALKVHVLE